MWHTVAACHCAIVCSACVSLAVVAHCHARRWASRRLVQLVPCLLCLCLCLCFTDISVRHCVQCRIRRVCLMLRRRQRRRLRCRSFVRSWYGGCCTVSVSAVLSVVLSLPWCPCLTGTVYGGAGSSSCCSPHFCGRTLCHQRCQRCLRCLRFYRVEVLVRVTRCMCSHVGS